ncbi:MAG: Transcriptional regulators of sugar metabolism [Firmicutes bacterium]|nr:Transcriptional regulators of sugar metabolism [Bacillota bacterium]MDI6706454.1 lactate utilization protein [Bacillota bacterium]
MDYDKISAVFNRRGFKTRVVESIEDACKIVLEEVRPDQSVGVGGSVTVKESGLTDMLRERGNKVYFHWEVEKSKIDETRKLASQADVYLVSSNAVTEDGKLVNIDGVGNRVASMFYGPDRVYVICGKNKIAKNEEEAVQRIKSVACPKNAERLDRKTPCRKTGKCHDCLTEDRMCSIKVVLEYCPPEKEINLILVDQELGY